jgi:uncharacterized protein DUF1488
MSLHCANWLDVPEAGNGPETIDCVPCYATWGDLAREASSTISRGSAFQTDWQWWIVSGWLAACIATASASWLVAMPGDRSSAISMPVLAPQPLATMSVTFLAEQPIYIPDRQTIRFVGLVKGGHINCEVTEEAILHLASSDTVVPLPQVLEIFDAHRAEIEALASLKLAQEGDGGDLVITLLDTERYRA